MLSSLGDLPLDKTVDLYIFVIAPQEWKGGAVEVMEKNFAEIAKQIGSRSVIAKGFSAELWTDEVLTKYLGPDQDKLTRLLPALLLTDSHPDELTDQSLRLLIPLHDADRRFGGLERFFAALVEFAHTRDRAFLDKFQNVDGILRQGIAVGLDVVEVKPSLFGISINVNNLVRRLTAAH